MSCRRCLEEKQFYKFVCRTETCKPICFDCGEDVKLEDACKQGHIVDETVLSPFFQCALKSGTMKKDWQKRCDKARAYLPKIENVYLVSKKILEQQELRDLQIVTDYNIEKKLSGNVGWIRQCSIPYSRNPDAAVVTSMEISIEQVAGNDVSKFGKTMFRVEFAGNGSTEIFTERLTMEKGQKKCEKIVDCCFIAHACYTMLKFIVTSDFEWQESESNFEMTEEPNYRVDIKLNSAQIGGNHCSSTRDTICNFEELFDDQVLFYPTNAMYHRGILAKFTDEEEEYRFFIKDCMPTKFIMQDSV